MSNPLQHTIEALAKEKGLEPDVIITAIEDAVLAASRKYYKSNEDLRTKFNAETGEVELFAVRQIVNFAGYRGDAHDLMPISKQASQRNDTHIAGTKN